MRLPWKQVRSLCEEKQSRGRGIRPRCETWAWGEGSPKAELGGQEAIAPPCLLPHRRYQAQKPRKGELGLFLFCSQPLPVSKLRAAARLTPPCPHPRRPFWREPAPPPAPPPPSWLRWSLTPACAQRPGTRRWTLPRTPPSPGRVPCTRGADGSIPSPSGALTARPPPRPPSAELTDAPQVAQGSDALSLARGPRLTCC